MVGSRNDRQKGPNIATRAVKYVHMWSWTIYYSVSHSLGGSQLTIWKSLSTQQVELSHVGNMFKAQVAMRAGLWA